MDSESVTLEDMPTLRQLYKLNQLVPAPANTLKFTTSGNLLDRVALQYVYRSDGHEVGIRSLTFNYSA